MPVTEPLVFCATPDIAAEQSVVPILTASVLDLDAMAPGCRLAPGGRFFTANVWLVCGSSRSVEP